MIAFMSLLPCAITASNYACGILYVVYIINRIERLVPTPSVRIIYCVQAGSRRCGASAPLQAHASQAQRRRMATRPFGSQGWPQRVVPRSNPRHARRCRVRSYRLV